MMYCLELHMDVYKYTRLACQWRCKTCEAVHDPIVLDDADEQQDAVSEDYSPLEYAPLEYKEYLQEEEELTEVEVGEPEPKAEEGSEPISDGCLTSVSETSSGWYEPYLTCSFNAATHENLC